MADRHPSSTVALTRAPALSRVLVQGALRSPFKRPHPEAGFPRTRLVLPGVRVAPARLAAYARVCGFDPADDALPVTYPHVLGFPLAMRLMSGRDFPLPLLGLVHTSMEIVRHTALPATGTYDLAVHVAGLAPHRRGTQATVVTELHSDGGEDGGGKVVWESRSTYLARHRTGARPTEPTGEAGEAGGSREPGEPGESLPAVAEWRIPEDIGRRYGAVSGDRNPIHLHPLTARLFGFPRAIAHGMWTVARCLAAHSTPQAALVRAEFRAPVLLPATVEYAADTEGRFALRAGATSRERVHLTGEVRPSAAPS
ncbi:MaoC/PaaZ C-terminal domain-containing protein [Streptomyces sp. NPDC046805]|uniref:MaoC family dehydratase n=1 Tax=Streptomyces sp. NPDC046805 TaxID=3155134 RepID=UPI0033EF5B03